MNSNTNHLSVPLQIDNISVSPIIAASKRKRHQLDHADHYQDTTNLNKEQAQRRFDKTHGKSIKIEDNDSPLDQSRIMLKQGQGFNNQQQNQTFQMSNQSFLDQTTKLSNNDTSFLSVRQQNILNQSSFFKDSEREVKIESPFAQFKDLKDECDSETDSKIGDDEDINFLHNFYKKNLWRHKLIINDTFDEDEFWKEDREEQDEYIKKQIQESINRADRDSYIKDLIENNPIDGQQFLRDEEYQQDLHDQLIQNMDKDLQELNQSLHGHDMFALMDQYQNDMIV